MGELREVDEKRRNDMYSTRLGLRAKSKTDQEIDRILRESYEKEFKGGFIMGMKKTGISCSQQDYLVTLTVYKEPLLDLVHQTQ